jgi:hypothetical protein
MRIEKEMKDLALGGNDRLSSFMQQQPKLSAPRTAPSLSSSQLQAAPPTPQAAALLCAPSRPLLDSSLRIVSTPAPLTPLLRIRCSFGFICL